LRSVHPEVHGRLELIREQVRATPVQALKFLIREPFIGGRRYVDFLDSRARENVDALLFTVAEAPPGDLELLLDRLELLSRQRDAGDVPQSGEGVQLVTVHRAKGLEWKVAAVFDLGRMEYHPPQRVYLSPHDGAVHHKDAPGFEAAKEAVKARELDESYRLLYVAASRARDVLLMTGSVKSGKPDGWARALAAMNLGPGARPYARDDFMLQAHVYRPVPPPPAFGARTSSLTPAPYIDRIFPHYPYPPVHSPSRYKSESFEPSEPLPFSDPDEGEILPGRATTVGTLVHYAISQDWSASNPLHLENLRAQEVMFPFSVDEQRDILQEVKELLASYESLLGTRLPALDERDEDHAELPMALPQGPTVWQGIIDRLYRVGEAWYLEDYKTDQEVNPERYHFQLAVYVQAVRVVKGVTPQVQLVYLRFGEVVRVPEIALEQAFASALS
jgi:ATP-dependent exoDNAse (exonuclease V) beta subunit